MSASRAPRCRVEYRPAWSIEAPVIDTRSSGSYSLSVRGIDFVTNRDMFVSSHTDFSVWSTASIFEKKNGASPGLRVLGIV